MSLIALRDIHLAFGGPHLLDGVSLQIEEGDRLCLLGRNGAGKSTLLKLLNGDLTSDGGEITRRQGLRVSLVSQESPPDLTGSVFDVVAGGMGDTAELLAEYHHVGIRLAAEGLTQSWKMCAGRRSPAFTTQLSDVVVAHAI